MVHVHCRESEISSSKRRADVDGDSIGKTGSMGTSGRTSIMVPPLEAPCYRYKKGEYRGQRNEWSNIRLLLYSGPVTTSHIRNNSPDYFPTGLQFANLLEKRIKYRRAQLPSRPTCLLSPYAAYEISHTSFFSLFFLLRFVSAADRTYR